MKTFTAIAVATAFLGLAACTKNEPAPAPVEAAPVEAAPVEAAPASEAAPVEAAGSSVKPVEGGAEQPK